ncbi:MAG: hypothetical protein AAF363_12055 [Bacteroidota bacterium]
MYKARAEGHLLKVEAIDFEKIAGRKPTSFARFAWDHRHYFL